MKQRGFSVVEIILAVIVVLVIGFVVYMFATKKSVTSIFTPSSFVEWSFDGENWAASNAPACEDPLSIASPMDVTKANAILLPGQVRGTDFKPHGGLSLDGSNGNSVNIYAVRDANLYRGSRYIQDGEVQYMFDFMDSCGVMYRLDHLATLTPEFMEFANRLPEPKPDDSRTESFSDHPFIAKGTLIATEAGIKNGTNVFFDLGVYDLRSRNAASKTDLYKTDQLRISDKEQSFFALCWFDLLPEPDRSVVKALPERNGGREGTSDYCTDWP